MMRCCGGVSDHTVAPLPAAHGRARKVWRWVFAVSTLGGWGFAERWVPSFLISPDATRPPGRKPRRPVIVATRCCGAAHGGPSLALTGCACLAGANDVRSPVAVSDNDPTRRPKTGTIDHADQDSLAVKTFNCDPGCRGARPLLTRQHAATRRARDSSDALGNATATAHRRPACHEYSQHLFAALARMAE